MEVNVQAIDWILLAFCTYFGNVSPMKVLLSNLVPRHLSLGKSLNNNDLNQVDDQRFSLKQLRHDDLLRVLIPAASETLVLPMLLKGFHSLVPWKTRDKTLEKRLSYSTLQSFKACFSKVPKLFGCISHATFPLYLQLATLRF